MPCRLTLLAARCSLRVARRSGGGPAPPPRRRRSREALGRRCAGDRRRPARGGRRRRSARRGDPKWLAAARARCARAASTRATTRTARREIVVAGDKVDARATGRWSRSQAPTTASAARADGSRWPTSTRRSRPTGGCASPSSRSSTPTRRSAQLANPDPDVRRGAAIKLGNQAGRRARRPSSRRRSAKERDRWVRHASRRRSR